jgi:hypothetical protein
MLARPLICAALLALGLTSAAATDFDFADASCKDILSLPEADLAGMLMWTEGYYSGKAGQTMFKAGEFEEGVKLTVEACQKNMDGKWLETIESLAN